LYALGASLIHLLTGISPADLPQRELRIQFRDKVSINPQFLNWIEALSEPDLGLRFKTASQALKKLKQGYLIKDNTPRIKPPASSKIKIDKSVADQLSITIPAKPMLLLRDLFGFALKIAPLIGTYILIMLIAIMFILIIPLGPYLVTLLLSLLISLGILMNIDFAFLILILSTTKMVFVVKKTMFSFKEWWLKFKRNTCKSIMNDIKRTSFVSLNSYRIQFDREGLIFECCKNYILFKMYDQPTKRNTRKTKLENTNYYNSYLQELTVNSDCHQIYLKTLTDTYTIRGLSQAECKWILKEIQTWLDQCQ
ncbi:MAG: hypothetical protein RIE73_28865, partial [Coleofasciculus sp. C1-SOL-03]